MKKIIALLCCFAFLFVLTSCDSDFVNSVVDFIGHTFYYEYDEISQNVEKAEIIKLTADYSYFSIDRVDESDVEILKTLDYEKTLEILQDFSQIEYADGLFVYNGPPSFDEICIRVWYLDGTFDIYCSSITTLAWGNCADIQDYYKLIDKYLEQ